MLQLSGLVTPDFFETVSDDYGVSDHDPPTLELASVTVPEGQFHLQPEGLAELQDSVDPLQESNNYGIDLYLAVLDSIHAHCPITLYTSLFCIVLWNQFYPKYSPWFQKSKFCQPSIYIYNSHVIGHVAKSVHGL